MKLDVHMCSPFFGGRTSPVEEKGDGREMIQSMYQPVRNQFGHVNTQVSSFHTGETRSSATAQPQGSARAIA